MLKPPADRWHNLILSARTGYSVVLTWLLSEFWRWSGPLTYVSLSLSVLSSSLHLGQWQILAWKVLYSAFFGSLVGYIVALTWETPVFSVVFFIACIVLNKISLWDQVSKIFAGLNFVVTALLPFGGSSHPFEGFVLSLLMVIVPILVVGFSLLIPFPSLAAASCAKKTQSVCRKLCEILLLYTYAFMYPDFSDVYLSEAETLADDVSGVLDALQQLTSCVEHEAILFPSLRLVPRQLAEFIDIVRKMIVEFRSMKEAHSRIIPNSTHRCFCLMLEGSIKEALTSMLLAIDVANSDLRHPYEHLWFEKKKDLVRRSLFRAARRARSYGESFMDKAHVFWLRVVTHCSHCLLSRLRRPAKEVIFAGSVALESSKDCDVCSDQPALEAPAAAADSELPVGLTRGSNFDGGKSSQLDSSRRRSYTTSTEIGGSSAIKAMSIGNWLDLELTGTVRRRTRSESHSGDGHYLEVPDGYSCDRSVSGCRARIMSIDADFDAASSPEKELSASADTPVFINFPVTSIDPAAVLLSSFLDSIEFDEIRAHPESATCLTLDSGGIFDRNMASLVPTTVAAAHPVWSRLFKAKLRLSADIEKGRLALIFLLNVQGAEPLSATQREVIKNENLTLGISNEAPRAAFMSRIVLLVSLLDQLRNNIHSAEPIVFSFKDFALSKAIVLTDFFYSGSLTLLREMLLIPQFLFMRCDRYRKAPASSGADSVVDIEKGCEPHPNPALAERVLLDSLNDLFYAYIQPVKISIACTLCAMLVIISSLRKSNPNGIWAALVVVIIRQDNASSSFLRGMQRLEGTLVGSVFAFGLLKLVAVYYTDDYTSCFYDTEHNFRKDLPEGTCSRGYYTVCIALVMLWVTFCANFREVKNHGYAASVAAFTPIILVLGSAGTGGANPEVGAWARVAMTFVGILVYILVDNLIYPNRSADFVRANTPTTLSELRLAVVESVASMKNTLSEESFTQSLIHRTRSSSQLGQHDHAAINKVSEPFRNVPKAVTAIKQELALRRFRLELAVLEPSFWYKPFPGPSYIDLQDKSDDLCMAIEAVLSAVALLESTKSNVVFAEQDAEGLALIRGLSATLMEVSDALNASLSSVSAMLSRVFREKNPGYNIDVSSMIVLSRKCDQLFLKIQKRFLAFYRVQLKRISSDAVLSCEVDRSGGGAVTHDPIRRTHSVSVSDQPSDGVLDSRRNEFLSLHSGDAGPNEDLDSASPVLPRVETDSRACRLEVSEELPVSDEVVVEHVRSDFPSPNSTDFINRTTTTTALPARLVSAGLGILAHSDFICAWQNVLESTHHLNGCLTRLGLALHRVFAAEAAAAVAHRG